MKQAWAPVLELTHNHGTENDAQFAYHDSNTEPKVQFTRSRDLIYIVPSLFRHNPLCVNFGIFLVLHKGLEIYEWNTLGCDVERSPAVSQITG